MLCRVSFSRKSEKEFWEAEFFAFSSQNVQQAGPSHRMRKKGDAVIQNKKVNPVVRGKNKHRLPNGPEKRDILSDQRGGAYIKKQVFREKISCASFIC